MSRILTLILSLAAFPALNAQLTDDFSDGDITANPVWQGDIAHFTVTPDAMLQLNAPTAGLSYINTGIVLEDSAEWQFYFRMGFAPSTSNRLRLYLMLDNTAPATANGYYLEIGENGSADALRLFRLDEGSRSEIGASAGMFGTDPTTVRVQVLRSASGMWSVGGDMSGGHDFSLLFSVQDNTYPVATAQRFGIECLYTDTRRDKFFFDDVYAGAQIKDVTAPSVLQVAATDALHVRVRCNERLVEASALEPGNFNITPNIGAPVLIAFEDAEETTVVLENAIPFSSGTEYTLHLQGLQDVAGNALDTSVIFTFFNIAQPEPFDLLINEIMADPSPVLGQPNAEYVELYNTSADAFQLKNYALTIGTQTVLLPAYVLPAGGYVLIVDDGTVDLFSAFQNIIAPNLPTLTNTGTTLELADDLGTTIHRLAYDLSSYQDPARDDGGWSLELINPLAVCALTGNLKASQDLTGGTPGSQNSVSQSPVPDTAGPALVSIFPLSSTRIQLFFDEVLQDNGYDVSLQPDHSITGYFIDENVLEVTLQTSLQNSTLYTIIVHRITDCLGNFSENQSRTFGLPEPAQEGDLVINEILFDPATGGSRFIEVYNISQRFIDLRELVIADIQGDTIAAYSVEESFLLQPASYAALTPDVPDLRMRYFMHDPAQLIQTTLPAFDRAAGNATIYTRSGVVLDVFDYQDDYHNTLLDDTRGVSLERLSPYAPAENASTWYSAAGSAGYATPGLPNSQRLPAFNGTGVVEIEPETFSPDGDGFDDILNIRFTNPPVGAVTRIRVFDTQGREIARIAENVSIGTNSIFRWDGVNSDGQRARIGPHVLWIELVSPNGAIEQFKKTCVVAERL